MQQEIHPLAEKAKERFLDSLPDEYKVRAENFVCAATSTAELFRNIAISNRSLLARGVGVKMTTLEVKGGVDLRLLKEYGSSWKRPTLEAFTVTDAFVPSVGSKMVRFSGGQLVLPSTKYSGEVIADWVDASPVILTLCATAEGRMEIRIITSLNRQSMAISGGAGLRLNLAPKGGAFFDTTYWRNAPGGASEYDLVCFDRDRLPNRITSEVSDDNPRFAVPSGDVSGMRTSIQTTPGDSHRKVLLSALIQAVKSRGWWELVTRAPQPIPAKKLHQGEILGEGGIILPSTSSF